MFLLKVEFLGHAAFLITEGEFTLLFDPFLTGNPLASKKADEIKPKHILVSHAHSDHLGDTVAIAKNSGAKVYTTFELGQMFEKEGIDVQPGNLGGWLPADFGAVKLFQAFHGSGIAGGHACGFVVELRDKKIYFAGDTALFGDMSLLQSEEIDLALLPIGDVFTMGIEDAAKAVEFIKPKNVIPMHYNTFPPIQKNPMEFKKLVEANTQTNVLIVKPGESVEI
ncbi:MAG: metal-dependent hydrolase [Tepidanaerobacteraceae bacterium]